MESEEIGKNATNEAQREKRYQFYERNGVQDTGYLIMDRGLTFHIMFLERQASVERSYSFIRLPSSSKNLEKAKY